MKYSSEASVPPAELKTMVAACAERIAPDNPELDTWYKEYVHFHKDRIAFDLDLVRRHGGATARIIEFGALPLLLTAPLAQLGYPLVSVDLRPERFSHAIAALGLDVVKCDIEHESLPFPDNSFDVAVFNELFEHLRIDPIFTMREVKRVLKPGGILLLSSPNLRSLAGIANFLLKNRCYSCEADPYEEFSKLGRFGHMGHVREYTTTEISGFLTAIGFEMREIVRRGTFGIGWADLFCRIASPLRPFASYVAAKRPG